MHLNFADQYKRGSSLVHRLDPRSKLIATVAFILAASLLPAGSWASYGLLLAGIVAAAWASGLGAGYALRRSFVALPFALAAVTLPFTVKGTVIGYLGGLTVTAEGLIRFLSIVVKSWISVQAAILLAVTTPFADLMWGLRELRVPKALVGIVAFMYRYLFVMGDEALRLMRARAARSAEASGGTRAGGSLAWRGRVAGGLVGNLAMRSFERSERIYDAMVARGFRGEMLALTPPALTDLDRNALVAWATFLALAILVGIFL